MSAVESGGLARTVRALHLSGSLSRSDIGAITGLNRSSVAAIVAGLVSAGMAEEQAGASGTVGRPSLVVRAVPDSLAVIGWDLRADSTSAVVMGFGGVILHRWSKEHRRGSTDPFEMAARVVTGCSQMAEELPDHVRLVGIGCAIPGVIDPGGDPPRSVIHRAPTLGWVEIPFGLILTEALREQFGGDVPVVLGNDANLGAKAEWMRGAGRASSVMLFVSGDVGIGGGLIVDGVPMTGASGYAGEIGHMRFEADGSPCRCGAHGCWETVIGVDTIVRSAGLDPTTAALDDVVLGAQSGDAACQRALIEASRALGRGLASLVNIVNPDTVVLAGHLEVLVRDHRHTILDEMRYTLSRESTVVRIVAPSLGPDSIVVGAAESAFERTFERPQRWLAVIDELRTE